MLLQWLMPSSKIVRAVCSHDCPDSCAVLVTVDELGKATRVQGDPAHPVTRGFLCGKVAKYLDRVYSPARLLQPMRRRTGAPKGRMPYGREADVFEPIGWDEALDVISARLRQISEEHGPESILPYSYAGTIGVLGYGSMDRRFFHRNTSAMRGTSSRGPRISMAITFTCGPSSKKHGETGRGWW